MNQEHVPTALPSEVFAALPQMAQDYIRALEKQVVLLVTQVQSLVIKVQELEARLAKDSSNSSKPPSSDGLGKKNKTTSLREKTGKKPGGQPGHTGRTLEQVSNPDIIKIHSPDNCQNCQTNLSLAIVTDIEKRQIFDLPEQIVQVTEHRRESKLCPCCSHINKAQFPDNVKAHTQYGERIRALAAYFAHQHLIPFERLTQIFEDLYGISLSPGTCYNADKKLYDNLAPFETNLKAHLLACKVLHFDETGAKCEKKLHWIHVSCSQTATHYAIHSKRGKEAIDHIDILPKFTGTAIHDHFYPYFSYKQVKHGLCNAHHLRELKYIYEQEKAQWAKKMETHLLKTKDKVKQAKAQGHQELKTEQIQQIHQEYEQIILEGALYYQELREKTEETQFKQSGVNLLKRLLRKKKATLAFVEDFAVPFTNNEAKQQIRMQKVKQKISGCYRTIEGGQISCRIRSYIATTKKQGWKILETLADAIRGSPRLLPIFDNYTIQI